MFTKKFWKATAERALKTFAQSAGAFLVAGGTGVLEADWQTAGSVSGMAALLSVLTSVASGGFGGDGPSLANEEPLTDEEKRILGKA